MYDYSNEQHSVIFLIDMKSFYASCEAVSRGDDPLTVPLVVASMAKNTGAGLILATSPAAKKKYGITNVSRVKDLPDAPDLVIVEPRMNYYIAMNMKVNEIFKEYVAEEDLHRYSIDESILDLTHSWKLFGATPTEVAHRIQREVFDKLGLYVTVGIGDNPTLAKLALDLVAKHESTMIGTIHYQDVPTVLWPITELDEVWSIGRRTAIKLRALGINSLGDLAHYNPYKFKQKLGVIGQQLFLLSWGIDRAVVREKVFAKSKSYGNSQVLPRDYQRAAELVIVIREIAEQVAARIRKHQYQATQASLYVGFSNHSAATGRNGFTNQVRITATNNSRELTNAIFELFHKNWAGEPVRHIGIYYSQLVPDVGQQLDLFTAPERQIQNNQVDRVVDNIRKRFGFTALVKASSLLAGGTAIERAGLVGGHRGGNSYE
ncbi:Y-family DNA polymerase [Periweissella cryptocerci]|uniref:Y-family DNA polymerase n=1 Tax=Periweissella cryptocerci TaxID=2506420 RepID=A0A4P6YR90_9LACO|nr:Y-family DNA polymerase [Periweissella cryptocerci]QBO35147.1 Y-family DNA polymerase [Periweissella cryptocerci]